MTRLSTFLAQLVCSIGVARWLRSPGDRNDRRSVLLCTGGTQVAHSPLHREVDLAAVATLLRPPSTPRRRQPQRLVRNADMKTTFYSACPDALRPTSNRHGPECACSCRRPSMVRYSCGSGHIQSVRRRPRMRVSRQLRRSAMRPHLPARRQSHHRSNQARTLVVLGLAATLTVAGCQADPGDAASAASTWPMTGWPPSTAARPKPSTPRCYPESRPIHPLWTVSGEQLGAVAGVDHPQRCRT
jgi:hypothetical protein